MFFGAKLTLDWNYFPCLTTEIDGKIDLVFETGLKKKVNLATSEPLEVKRNIPS